MLYSWVGSCPHPQTLDLAGKTCQCKHSSLLQKSINYNSEKFYSTSSSLTFETWSVGIPSVALLLIVGAGNTNWGGGSSQYSWPPH